MSTSPDQVVQTLSWWLAGRVGLEQLADALAGASGLGPVSTELVEELREKLAGPDLSPTTLQPLVRETIEAIAHGD